MSISLFVCRLFFSTIVVIPFGARDPESVHDLRPVCRARDAGETLADGPSVARAATDGARDERGARPV